MMRTPQQLTFLAVFLSAASTSHALTTLATGETSNQQYAQTIVKVGDINNDGVEDYAIGNTRYTAIDSVSGKKLPQAGKVQIFSGVDDSIIWEKIGTAAKQEFGASIIAADINGDAKMDIAIGAPGHYFKSGMVLVAVQQAGSTTENILFNEHRVFGNDRNSRFGSALSVAPLAGEGSVNNLFLLVGSPLEKNSPEWTAPTELQALWPYSAKPHKKRVGAIFGYRVNLLLNKPLTEVSQMRIFGAAANSQFGSQITWLADSGTLAISAPKHNKTGSVMLWDTNTNYSALNGVNKGENFGQVVQLHNNQQQLVISAPLTANAKLKKAGRVDIFQTADWQLAKSLHGEIAGAEFGSAIASTETTLLISSPKASNPNSKQKQIGLLQGFSGEEENASQLQWGEYAGELFGSALVVHNERTLVASPGYSSLDNKKLKKIGRVSILAEEPIIE